MTVGSGEGLRTALNDRRLFDRSYSEGKVTLAADAFDNLIAAALREAAAPAEPFRPDYDWTSTCPHDDEESCPDECACECHAIPEQARP